MFISFMIFLSGSIGVFFEPVVVSNKAIVVAILIIAFIYLLSL